MKIRILLLTVALLFAGVHTGIAGNVEADKRVEPVKALTSPPTQISCPITLDDWKNWRDSAVKALLKPRISNGDLFLDTNQVIVEATAAANFIDDCYIFYGNAAELDAAIGNLRKFANVLRTTLSIPAYDHQFGYTIDDFTYLSQVTANVDLPALLKSGDFLHSISNRETYNDAYKMIVEQNKTLPADKQWIVLLYKSRFLTTPDEANTFGRFFVYIPGDDFDKWIQFGIKIPEDDSTTPINNLSIVSVAKPDGEGRRFNAIIDWWRTYVSGWSVKLATRRESQGITENCVMCHKTSPLGIHPAEEYQFDTSGKLVLNTTSAGQIPQQLNNLITEYGAPYFNGWADTSNYGPALAPDIQRSDGFMKSCTAAQQLDQPSIDKVRASMNCSNCHSGSGVGLLNFPATTRHIKSAGNQIYQYITQGWMPPRKTLSPNEREALYQCVMQEYYDFNTGQGLFVDWLSNKPAPALRVATTRSLMAGSGEDDFDANCGDCHSKIAGETYLGPSLFGVSNRAAGTGPGFAYSPSYVEAGKKGVVWNDANLFSFLADPVAFLSQKIGHPATSKMTSKFPDSALRNSIIGYLKTLK